MTQTNTSDTQSGMQMSSEMTHCIRACRDCETICLQTVAYCLNKGGKHAAPDHIGALLDCIRTCASCVDLMVRMSPLHPRMCGVCAEACRVCADSCEKMAADPEMKACAETCRKCADACRRMAATS